MTSIAFLATPLLKIQFIFGLRKIDTKVHIERFEHFNMFLIPSLYGVENTFKINFPPYLGLHPLICSVELSCP